MRIVTLAFAGIALLALCVPASALSISLVDSAADAAESNLAGKLLAPASGITIVGSSWVFLGNVGPGNEAQSGWYTGFTLVPTDAQPTVTNPDGIFLTSGTANIPLTNTDPAFDPFTPGTGSDADLVAILTAAGAPSNTVNDVNYIMFDFTVEDDITSVEADFVFASDEFPDQPVTDVFAFIVDGVNYAYFQDGSLVSFVTGVNAGNFNDNDFNPLAASPYAIEYDGLSNSLHVVGLLNPDLTTHTIKIAIADTSDSIFDSGVFIGNLFAGQGEGGGIDDDLIIPEPSSIALLGLGLAGLGLVVRKRRRA